MSHSAADAQRINRFTKELNPANISELIDLIPAIYMPESHEISYFSYFLTISGFQNLISLRGNPQMRIKNHENRSWG